MLSPGLTLPQANQQVDEESIAFGVMYCPRVRVQRIDEINYNTRLLRQLENELESPDHFIEGLNEQADVQQLGFVTDGVEGESFCLTHWKRIIYNFWAN